MSIVKSERRDWTDVQERILAAAGELFAERRAETVGLDDVARAAGVGRATVFRHVGSKQALIDAVYDRRAADLLDLARRALAFPDPWGGLELLVRTLGARLGGDRGLFAEPAAEPSVAAASQRYADVVTAVDAVLARARVAKELHVDLDAVQLIQVLRTHSGTAGPGGTSIGVEILLRGLRADPARPVSASTLPAATTPPAVTHVAGPRRPSLGSRSERSELSRRRILDATIEIASERGYEGTTMAAVSERAGLPVTSLYWHFADKDDLLAEVITRSADRWQGDVAAVVSAAPVSTVDEVFNLLQDVVRASVIGSPAFLRLGLMLALERRPVDVRARQVYLARRHAGYLDLVSLVDGVLAEGSRPGARPLVLAFMALVDGLLVRREIDGADLDDLDGQLDLVTSALRSAVSSG